MDAISVSDNFTVGTVSVSDINVAHTHVGALQVSQQLRYMHSHVWCHSWSTYLVEIRPLAHVVIQPLMLHSTLLGKQHIPAEVFSN